MQMEMKVTKEMHVSPEGEYSNVSSELSNAQGEEYETDANGIEVIEQPEVFLEAENSAETNAVEVLFDADNLGMSTEESNVEKGHKSDPNGNEATKEMNVSPEHDFLKVSSEMSHAQEKDHDTDAHAIEATQQPNFSLEAENYAETNAAEGGTENDENGNKLTPEMQVSLDTENLELPTQESDAQAGHETEANGNEVGIEMNVSPEGEYSSVSPKMSNVEEKDQQTDDNGIEVTPYIEALLEADKLEPSTDEANAEAGHETDANLNETMKDLELSAEGEHSNLTPEMSNSQVEYHETDADGIEVTLQPDFSLEAENSAEPNAAEEGSENYENAKEFTSEMDVSLDAENLELSAEESNAQAGHETDANGNEVSIEIVSPERKYSNVSPEMSIAQEEDHETNANRIEVNQQPEVLLEADISAQPNPAEEGPENDENQNELTPDMEVSLEAENLELSTDESNAEARHETDANGNETIKDMELSLETEHSNLASEMSNCSSMKTMKLMLMELKLTQQPDFSLEAENSAEPNAAEEGSENYENANELTPEMDVSLDAENLELSTEESNAASRT